MSESHVSYWAFYFMFLFGSCQNKNYIWTVLKWGQHTTTGFVFVFCFFNLFCLDFKWSALLRWGLAEQVEARREWKLAFEVVEFEKDCRHADWLLFGGLFLAMQGIHRHYSLQSTKKFCFFDARCSTIRSASLTCLCWTTCWMTRWNWANSCNWSWAWPSIVNRKASS